MTATVFTATTAETKPRLAWLILVAVRGSEESN
jgi:hypothetical protein